MQQGLTRFDALRVVASGASIRPGCDSRNSGQLVQLGSIDLNNFSFIWPVFLFAPLIGFDHYYFNA